MQVNDIRWRSKGNFTREIAMRGLYLREDVADTPFTLAYETPSPLDLMFASARMGSLTNS